MSGYDCRPDLKAPYTAIVRARDEGELSLAAAQLNGGLRQKFTHHDRSGHGHSGVHALYARFAPDAASHLADLGAVAISANYLTLLRHDYAIDPIACIVRVRKAAIVVARRGMFGRTICEMVTRRERPREQQIAMVVRRGVPVCVRHQKSTCAAPAAWCLVIKKMLSTSQTKNIDSRQQCVSSTGGRRRRFAGIDSRQ